MISADHAAAAARDGFFACSHGDGARRRAPAARRPLRLLRPARALRRRRPPCRPSCARPVTDAAPEHALGGFEALVRRAPYEVGRPPVRPLLDRLGFVRDKGSHWGMAFRRGLFA